MQLSKSNNIIIITTIASFIVAYISVGLSVALPTIAHELALDNVTQNWVVNSFLISVAVFAVPTGSLSGKIGLKKSFLIGNLIFLLGSIFSPLAFSPLSLIIFRAFQGLGAAIIYNTVMNIVTLGVSPKQRGRALGIVISGVYIGLAMAPVLGGVLTYNFGWRTIFYFSIPFILLVIGVTAFKLKDEWKFDDGSFDAKGGLIWGIAIFLFVYGFSKINMIEGIICAVLGLILLGAFTYFETKVDNPVYDVKVFKNKLFAASTIASLISYIATYFVSFVLSYHLQYIMGWNVEITGFFLIIGPLIQTLISAPAGKLSDRINPLKIALFGMVLVCLAMFLLCFLSSNSSIYLIISVLIIQGIGFGIFTSPNTNIMMSSLDSKDTPTASMSVTIVRVVGQTLSLAMLTIIYAMIMGNVEIIPKYYGLLILSSRWACIVGTILCLISVLIYLIRYKDLKHV